MFTENKDHPCYLGFVKKVFDDMQKKSQLLESGPNSCKVIQFQVKLLDMKYFLDSAKQHVQLAIKKQVQDLQDQSDQIKPRKSDYNHEKLSFQPDEIPNLDELYAALHILADLEEQLWIQTRSNQCPSDVKNFMNSVSRPFSALNRLGSFTSFGIQGHDSQGHHRSDTAS
jgi:hypothetical protein